MSDGSEISPVIVIDSREPAPSPWEPYFTVPTMRGTLQTGDYSLLGCESLISVERKSINDLVACFCAERERFVRELQRFQAIPTRFIICEGRYEDLLAGRFHSQMNPKSAFESGVALMVRFGIPLLMAGDTATAGRLCESILMRWVKEHAKVLSLIETAGRKALPKTEHRKGE
jgi:DNA excision repair protein ERCC-4